MNKTESIGLIILIALMIVYLIPNAEAGEYTNTQIVNAIYKAENSKKYPYGIVSIDTKGDEVYARKICYNTVRNHRKRHLSHDDSLTYLECLSKRYAPVGAKNDPSNLNVNWLSNVKYFLKKARSK